jgi:hypothetical protein
MEELLKLYLKNIKLNFANPFHNLELVGMEISVSLLMEQINLFLSEIIMDIIVKESVKDFGNKIVVDMVLGANLVIISH